MVKKIFTILAILLLLTLTACKAPIEEPEGPITIIEPYEEAEYPFGDAPLKTFALKAYRFQFEPNKITVNEGDHVMLTITSLDVGHGFALPDFGINEKIPPEDSESHRMRVELARPMSRRSWPPSSLLLCRRAQ